MLNKVQIIGNVGRDPEVRSMQTGSRVANLSVATSESWKDKNTGERREKTDWHNVVVFNENIVNFIENYVKKGSKVYIEGKIETRTWEDNQGVKKYMTEVVVRPFGGELKLLDKIERDQSSHDRAKANGYQPDPIDDFEDEIPF
jgi:single-strand DNA-binding protein